MAITEEQFKNAAKGDAFVDMYDRPWVVLRNKGEQTLGHTVEVRFEEGLPEDLTWYKSEIIEREEIAVIIELNSSNAHYRTATERAVATELAKG